MNSDFDAILKSKQSLRLELANLPIDEKIRLLEALRDRQLAIAASRQQISPGESNASGLKSPPQD